MSGYTPLAKCTLGISWALTSLGFASTALPVLVLGEFKTDDGLVAASFLLSAALVSLSTWAIVDEGQGSHETDMSATQLEHMAKSLLVAEALWSVANSLVRISACLLLSRLFGVFRAARRGLVMLMVLCALLAGASVLQVFLMCTPLAATWDKNMAGTCGDQAASFMAFESLGLALDVAVLAVPAVYVMRLKLPLQGRLAAIVVLDAGAIVLAVSAFRMKALHDAVGPDFAYSSSYMSLLSAVGTMTGIICCGIPGLRAIVVRRQRGRHGRGDRVDEVVDGSDISAKQMAAAKSTSLRDLAMQTSEDGGADMDRQDV
ncbi:integral membrane protein, partial [Metarhizium brunneum ARSEF 3297]